MNLCRTPQSLKYVSGAPGYIYNIQIQKYIANKKIIQNYAQMKYKWPVTAIKPLKKCDQQP